MSSLPTVVVDAHSHVFNAEDLPIDGFIKRLAPTPKLLTGIVSVPLDRLTQWVAPGSREGARIVALLTRELGLESLDDDDANAGEIITDEEVDRLFGLHWARFGIVAPPMSTSGLEALDTPELSDDELADALRHAPPVELHELQGWLEEVGPDARRTAARGLESLGGLVDYARSAKRAVVSYARCG